jgi:hypothetical protein
MVWKIRPEMYNVQRKKHYGKSQKRYLYPEKYTVAHSCSGSGHGNGVLAWGELVPLAKGNHESQSTLIIMMQMWAVRKADYS